MFVPSDYSENIIRIVVLIFVEHSISLITLFSLTSCSV